MVLRNENLETQTLILRFFVDFIRHKDSFFIQIIRGRWNIKNINENKNRKHHEKPSVKIKFNKAEIEGETFSKRK